MQPVVVGRKIGSTNCGGRGRVNYKKLQFSQIDVHFFANQKSPNSPNQKWDLEGIICHAFYLANSIFWCERQTIAGVNRLVDFA